MQEKQNWNAAQYADNARFVADLAEPVVELLAPKKGERLLDLGCGDGALTLKFKEMGLDVTGVDPSENMVKASQALGLDAKIAAGEELPFRNEFDAVFSNAALHWVNDIDKVVANVKTSLKNGGRFVGEFGGKGNVAAIATAMIAILNKHGIDGEKLFPWYFPTVAEFSKLLEKHGFEIKYIELIPRPTFLKTGMRNWLKTFANPFIKGLKADISEQILDEAVALLKPSLSDDSGNWTADYVRLRFAAFLPE